MKDVSQELKDKIKKIKLLVLDVDGVLTDGKIIYLTPLRSDSKAFDVKDGFGVTLLYRAGIQTVLLTARASRTIMRRAKDMHVARVYQNAFDKLSVYEKIMNEFGVSSEEVCFVGDDLIDLPVLSRVGFSVCTACAVDDLKSRADYITTRPGGFGAVRETADLILKIQGKWAQVTAKYYR